MIRKSPDVLERMKIHLILVFAGLILLWQVAVATPAVPAEAAIQQPGGNLETLIRKLSDESFRVREKASQELWDLGETALPALKEAATSSDPEQVFRARDLIRKIQLHITPDTDPSVIALVERYAKASPSEKSALFGRMRGKRAWRQMLKLYASETNPEVREKLGPSVNGVAVKAARERISEGDAPGAREFLEMAPADAEGLLALAEFHRSHGSLEAELNRAKAIKGPKSHFWQLALQRAAGNLESAANAAAAAGEPRIAAVMEALLGDPLPWFRETKADSADDPVTSAYAAIATKRWLGQKARPADLAPLTRGLSVRNRSERIIAMNLLFMLGEVETADAAFAKNEPLFAFRHFEALERIPEALKTLGLDPGSPDYKTWVEKRVEKLTADDIEDQHGVSMHHEELLSLANFLERRGLHDDLFAAFSPALAALLQKDEDTFLDFLGALFGNRETLSGAPLLAKRIGISWAGQDEAHWKDLIISALGDDEQSSVWWDWLSELDPKASHAERLDGMLALFGLGAAPSGLREKWLSRAWKAVAESPAGIRTTLTERIATLSIDSGDVTNYLKAWDRMPEESREKVSWEQQLIHLSANDRWNEAAAVILKQIALIADAKQEPKADLHAYAAAVLRQAGRPEEAATHDLWVDKLALGSASLAIRIGNFYAAGRDYEHAGEWWARAAREADPDSSEFALAMKLHADGLLEDGKWRESAAISEVVARIYASSDYSGTTPLPLMRLRLQADMSRALAHLKDDRSQAIAILANCHRTFASDGSLADFFFPAIRKMGLVREHDQWFAESWDLMESIISRYPASDNTRNTAAWFASRAGRKLAEAEKHLAVALAANPDQPAYLDTMAEIQFAKGNRAKALEWSKAAVNFAPDDPQLRRQQERFLSDPLPK